MYQDRKALYQELENKRSSKVLVYVTGDRRGLETVIHQEVLDFFSEHLDSFGSSPKVSLLLYSRGGNTLAGWSIVNLIRQYCKSFEVIVPSKAHSTATLICLGADNVVMTKQATLGPIDPSVNGPLNPPIPGQGTATLPVSVEDVAGFMDLARKELHVKGQAELLGLMTKLAEKVHPLVLGNVYRSRAQIQMLAEKLLAFHWNGPQRKKRRIISVLCTEAGSHDYTISRREARDDLGLKIETPSMELYELINKIYQNIRDELELLNPFNLNTVLGANQNVSYSFRQALVESLTGGSHYFATEGALSRVAMPPQQGGQIPFQNQVSFAGWRYDKP